MTMVGFLREEKPTEEGAGLEEEEEEEGLDGLLTHERSVSF